MQALCCPELLLNVAAEWRMGEGAAGAVEMRSRHSMEVWGLTHGQLVATAGLHLESNARQEKPEGGSALTSNTKPCAVCILNLTIRMVSPVLC